MLVYMNNILRLSFQWQMLYKDSIICSQFENAKIFGDQPPLLLKDYSVGPLKLNGIMGYLKTALDTASD